MRIRIGSGFGIPVYLHWTFFLLPLWIIFMHSGPPEVPVALTGVLLLFVCVVLHEFGHALMARRFGIDTQDVTLYPIGGVARLKKMADKPLEEFFIAVAGPAVNVVIAIPLFLFLMALWMFDPGLQWLPDSFIGQVAGLVFVLNLIMVPFNLLPAFPMDGGRVLRALLSSWLGHYQGTLWAVRIGFVVVVLMATAGFRYSEGLTLMPVIAIFIIFAGQQELIVARMREQRRRWHEEEPLLVLPARPPERYVHAAAAPDLMLRPKISVYTWDTNTGTWRQEPSAPA